MEVRSSTSGTEYNDLDDAIFHSTTEETLDEPKLKDDDNVEFDGVMWHTENDDGLLDGEPLEDLDGEPIEENTDQQETVERVSVNGSATEGISGPTVSGSGQPSEPPGSIVAGQKRKHDEMSPPGEAWNKSADHITPGSAHDNTAQGHPDSTSDSSSAVKNKKMKQLGNLDEERASRFKYIFRSARFFMIKSNNFENVEIAKNLNVWATMPQNEARLNQAYRQCCNVILIFSVQGSGHFQGFARLASESDHTHPPVRWCLPRFMNPALLSGTFRLSWINRNALHYGEVSTLNNPWNENKPVKIGRDGQEIEPMTGETLCKKFAIDESVDLRSIAQLSKQALRRKAAGLLPGGTDIISSSSSAVGQRQQQRDDRPSDRPSSSSRQNVPPSGTRNRSGVQDSRRGRESDRRSSHIRSQDPRDHQRRDDHRDRSTRDRGSSAYSNSTHGSSHPATPEYGVRKEVLLNGTYSDYVKEFIKSSDVGVNKAHPSSYQPSYLNSGYQYNPAAQMAPPLGGSYSYPTAVTTYTPPHYPLSTAGGVYGALPPPGAHYAPPPYIPTPVAPPSVAQPVQGYQPVGVGGTFLPPPLYQPPDTRQPSHFGSYSTGLSQYSSITAPGGYYGQGRP